MGVSRIKLGNGRRIRTASSVSLNWLRGRVQSSPEATETEVKPVSHGSPVTGAPDHRAQAQHASDLAALAGAGVLVVGAGAVNSYSTLNLGPYGLVLHAVDPDKVEDSNTWAGRTVYHPGQCGMPKVEALQTHIQRSYPQTRLVTYPHRYQDLPAHERRRLLDQCAVGIGGFDDHRGLLELNAEAYARLPMLYPGMHRGGESGHIVVTAAGLPCLRCALELDEDHHIQTLHGEPAAASDIQRLAHQVATMALALLKSEVLGEPVTRWDLRKNIVYLNNQPDESSPEGPGVRYVESAAADPVCPVCGPNSVRRSDHANASEPAS